MTDKDDVLSAEEFSENMAKTVAYEFGSTVLFDAIEYLIGGIERRDKALLAKVNEDKRKLIHALKLYISWNENGTEEDEIADYDLILKTAEQTLKEVGSL